MQKAVFLTPEAFPFGIVSLLCFMEFRRFETY